MAEELEIQCKYCGVYMTPVIKEGHFYCSVCGTDITEQVREIDPEYVEEIQHSSLVDEYSNKI